MRELWKAWVAGVDSGAVNCPLRALKAGISSRISVSASFTISLLTGGGGAVALLCNSCPRAQGTWLAVLGSIVAGSDMIVVVGHSYTALQQWRSWSAQSDNLQSQSDGLQHAGLCRSLHFSSGGVGLHTVKNGVYC